MELIKKEVKEIEYTIKLTEKELNTLILGIGASSDFDRRDVAHKHNADILIGVDASGFYSYLLRTFIEKEKVE